MDKIIAKLKDLTVSVAAKTGNQKRLVEVRAYILKELGVNL